MTNDALRKACVTAIRDCMGTQQNEKILVITDEIKRDIGNALHKTALELNYESVLLEIQSREMHGEEPSDEVAEFMQKFDVVLVPTAKSMTHTDARRNASAKGCRVATFPGITEEIMIKGLSADYNKIAERTLKLKDIFEQTKVVRVTAPNGTDITMDITGREAKPSKGLFHAKGESGNLPTGETFAAPLEGKSNGVFVVDGSMSGLGIINQPITIKVENGYATDITGGEQADELVEILEKYGKVARNIAEFGVGTNDSASLTGQLLLDEKVMGTIHIALGDNKSMGGNVNAPIHLDGVVKEPTVYFDGKTIMKDGNLLID